MAKGQISLEFFLISFVSLILVTILSYAVILQKDSLISSASILRASYVSEADARSIENSLYSGFVMNYNFTSNSSYRIENGVLHQKNGQKVVEINGVFYAEQ